MARKRFTAEQIITGSAPVARSSLMAVSASGARLSAQAKTPARVLCVVALTDGETIRNAFFDRRFRKDQP